MAPSLTLLCSVHHLNVRVVAWVDVCPTAIHEGFVGHMALSEGTRLRQFLFEVVHSASNLRTLRCSFNRFYEGDVGCGAVALSFPQLARLRALELEEGPYASRRCFIAVYIALRSHHDR